MKSFLYRYWFLLALGVVIVCGLVWPAGGRALRSFGAMPYLIGITLFISGLMLDTSRLVKQTADWRAILFGLTATYGLAPIVAYALCRVLGPDGTEPGSDGAVFLQATMLSAAQAGTLSSALALTIVARGNQELALLITVLSNALAALLTPLILDWSIGAVVTLDVGEMIEKMLLVVVLPVFLGQIARRLLWTRIAKTQATLRRIPQAIILLFVYYGFGVAAERLTQDMALAGRFLLVCVLLHLVMVGATFLGATLMRMREDTRAAVVFCGSQKTLPNGIYLWERFFADNPYGAVPIVLYHVFQLVFDTFLVPWLTPKSADQERSDS